MRVPVQQPEGQKADDARHDARTRGRQKNGCQQQQGRAEPVRSLARTRLDQRDDSVGCAAAGAAGRMTKVTHQQTDIRDEAQTGECRERVLVDECRPDEETARRRLEPQHRSPECHVEETEGSVASGDRPDGGEQQMRALRVTTQLQTQPEQTARR